MAYDLYFSGKAIGGTCHFCHRLEMKQAQKKDTLNIVIIVTI